MWVLDDAQMPAAKQQLEAFSMGKVASDTARAAAELRKQRAQEQERAGRRFVHAAERWREGPALGFGPITVFLLVASVLAGFASDFGDATTMTIQNLSIEPWDSGALFGRIREGEVWRLLTPMLIHFGIVHLLFNMMWLWQLGRQIEQNHGSLAMILLVLFSEIPGGIGQYLVTGPSFGGMSGVVYGLFGFVWMQARYDPRHRYRLDDSTAILMMIWFVACATGLLGPIANIGHAAGLVAGLLAGMPVYIGHLRDHVKAPEFVAGNWASVNVKGYRRVLRQYVRPFVPLLFVLLAAGVILLEQLAR